MMKWLVAATALALSTPSFAQQTPEAQPATAQQAAEARAHADAVIAAAAADDLFVNVSQGAVPMAKHRASGMVCSFSGDQHDRISIYPSSDGISRGEDVSCGSVLLNTDITFYATRYADKYTPEQIAADAVRAIRHRFPDAREHPGGIAIASRDGMQQPLGGGFDVKINGADYLTLVIVAHQGPWSFKARATGPREDETIDLLVAAAFLLSLPEANAEN